MKTHIKIIGTLLLLLALNVPLSTVRALTTAFTYQGRLNESNAPANGSYDIAFTLFATNMTGNAVAGPVTNTNVIVTNGLFTTTVDFGPDIFTGTNYWLEIAVSTNGVDAFGTLAPRQPLTPAPYATFAEGADAAGLSGTIPAANVGGTYGNPVSFDNGQNSFDGTFSGLFFGSSFVGGNFVGNGNALTGVWHTVGDFGTTPQQNFLGTADNQPLVIKVNGQQAFEFVPATNTPNVVGGSAFNSVGGAGAYGITIGGGGQNLYPNVVQAANNASFATIAGGASNNISGSNVFHSVIGGGSFNAIAAAGDVYQSTIAGGTGNLIQSPESTISGGQANRIGTNSTWATVSGGLANSIQDNTGASFIGSGYANAIQSDAKGENDFGLVNSVIVGGELNTIETNSGWAFIGGGYQNTIQPYAREAVIGGGSYNTIVGSSNRWWTNIVVSQTIAGGNDNSIQADSFFASIGGGAFNSIGTNSPAVAIGGGQGNGVQANCFAAIIGGGSGNQIQGSNNYSVVSGGGGNGIQSNSFASFIGGGLGNQIQSYATYSTVGGGFGNVIGGNSNNWATGFGIGGFIGGGGNNQIQANSQFSTIAGGVLNIISSNSGWATIAGGAINTIGTNSPYATIAGGEYNIILANATNATISGGMSNLVGGFGGTVPGGTANLAGGLDSFAAGTEAQATNDGSFVLTDDIATNFYSTTSNQLSLRFTGGVRLVTGGAGMTLDGQPILSGGSTVGAGQLSGTYTNPVTLNNSANTFVGNGSGLANVNAATLGGVPSTGFWKTTGNSGTSPGANFIGTTDGQALLIKAPFVGVGRTTPITGADQFSIDAPVGSNSFGGMYINTTNVNGQPFYGYALGGNGNAYHYVDGADGNKWKLYTGGAVGGIHLTVMANGNVGIGTTAPDALLSVNGTADKPGGGSWNTFSDARLKDVGTNFTHGLEALEEIQPVNYHYKKDNALNLPSQPEYVGVIAQQVKAAVPEAVQLNGSGYLTVNNDPIIWTMVNAIKELNHKVDEKDAENAKLKQELAGLEEQVRELARERER